MFRLLSFLAPQTKIGLATSALVHVGLAVAVGLVWSTRESPLHVHRHRGSIELQGSFALSEIVSENVTLELTAESILARSVSEEFDATAAELPPEKRVTKPRPLLAQHALLTELAVCDCLSAAHAVSTPKRQTSEPPQFAMADVAPPPTMRRAELVAPVSASALASVPAPAEPAGSEFDEAPRFTTANRPPPYPAEAFRLGQQGRVMLEVRLTPEGRVESLRVIESSGAASLDRAALDTVRGWRFEPARRRGVPVAATVNVPVRFAIP